nr:zinc finger, CCHC-type [Tanacetum cinerariifolium]
NIDIEIEEEDQALMLLTSLPSSYENFVETLLYEKESLIMKDVMATLNLRELKKRIVCTKEETCDGLYVRFICHSVGHLKRDCPMKSNGSARKGKHDQDSDYSNDEGNTYFEEALVVVENEEMTELTPHLAPRRHHSAPFRTMHTTHMRDFLYEFMGFDGGLIQFGDNRTCTINGLGKVKIRLHDGSSFMPEDVRYVLGLIRSFISLGTLEKEGYIVKMHMGKIKVIKCCRVMMTGIRNKKCTYTFNAKVMTYVYKIIEAAQENCEAEVFQISNDDVVVSQRRLRRSNLKKRQTRTVW